jgi:plasmid maintenance system antidote protein VapI
MPIKRVTEYRQLAEECRLEAERAKGHDKEMWLGLREKWLALAENVEEQTALRAPKLGSQPRKHSP